MINVIHTPLRTLIPKTTSASLVHTTGLPICFPLSVYYCSVFCYIVEHKGWRTIQTPLFILSTTMHDMTWHVSLCLCTVTHIIHPLYSSLVILLPSLQNCSTECNINHDSHRTAFLSLTHICTYTCKELTLIPNVYASRVSNFYSTWSIFSFTWHLGHDGFVACDTLQHDIVLVKMLKRGVGRHAIDIYQWRDNNCPPCERWRWQTGSVTLKSGKE